MTLEIDLTEQVRQRALEQGFDLIGVAESGPARTGDALDRWLADGMHGDMAYMSRTRNTRLDPQHLLDGCRSVIVVAMSYRTGLPESGSFDPMEGRAWVSRYAWGRDYHKTIKKRLVRLGRWLSERRPDCNWRTCVDTAPVLEREWAARAGLGWVGKNTMVMNRRLGCELFLGILLTDLSLRPDTPVPEHCGTCTACLDACPTGALVEPFVLDARRCVAYLTVEHRTEIPRELQRKMGTMIAGCDICQEVCPWTRKGAADLHEEFGPAAGRYRPRIRDLQRLTEEEFRIWRRGSALNRISFAQFRRNLAIARRNAARVG